MAATLIVLEANTSVGGAAGPETLPLFQLGNLQYSGAFRVPKGTFGASSFSLAGVSSGSLAYNPAGNSLFILGNDQDFPKHVAEISIPTLSTSLTMSAWPTATVVQPFVDPAEGTAGAAMLNQDYKAGGLLVFGTQLYASNWIYYDGNGAQSVSHYRRPLNLSDRGHVEGFYKLMSGTTNLTGYVSGGMALVPAAWRAPLGGTILSEQSGIPIPSRTTFGQSAVVWDPASFGPSTPATPLMYFTTDHPISGSTANSSGYDAVSRVWNGSTEIRGVVFPEGYRSVLYFGRQGLTYCYGQGVNLDPSIPGSQVVESNGGSGANASTDSTGRVVSLPNVRTNALPGDWVWLKDQTSPNIDGKHPGASYVTSYANSGAPNATVTVAAGFPPGLANQRFNAGSLDCFDPFDVGSKGNHGYPYVTQVWAYDAADLLAVKNGQKQPWDPRPYGLWDISARFPAWNATGDVCGAAYDPATGRIFLCVPAIDGDAPAIYVFSMGASGSTNPPATPRNVRIMR